MEIFKLFGSVFIDDKDANKSLDSIDQKADKTGLTLGGMIGTATKWGAGIVAGATAAGAGLFALASKASDTASEINDMSVRTGLSTDRLQELKFATGQVGVNFEAITGAVGKLTKTMAGADEGSAKAEAAFKKLGISSTDAQGNMRSMDDIFPEVVKGLAGMTNETERNQLAMDFFGKGAMELVPLLAAGGDGIDAMTKQAHELGIVMSGDAISAGDKFGDSLDAVKAAAGGLVASLGVGLMPAFQSMMDWVTSHMPEIKSGIADAVDGATVLFHGFGDAIQFVIDHSNIFLPILTGITAAITAQAIIGTVTGLYKAWQAATVTMTTVQWLLNAAMNANPLGLVALAIGALIAVGVLLYQNWDTIVKFLSDSWTWMKTAAVDVFNSLVDFFIEWGPLILAALTGPIGLLIYAIIANWDQIKAYTLEVWNSIMSFFTTDIPAAFNTVIGFFAALPGQIYAFLQDLFLVKIPYAVGYAIGFMIQAFTEGIPKVIQFFKDLPETIWTWLTEVITKFTEWSRQIIEDAVTTGGEIIKSIIDFFAELPGKVWDWLTKTITKLIEWSGNAKTKAGEAGKSILDSVIEFVQQLPGKLLTWFLEGVKIVVGFGIDAYNAAKEVGSNIVNGIVDFIKDIPQKVDEFVGGIVKKVLGVATSIKKAISGIFKSGSEGIEAGKNANSGSPTPEYAVGTNYAQGGLALVGEQGPELVNLPRGSQVMTNSQTEQLLGNGAPIHVHNHIYLDGKKIAENVSIHQESAKRKIGRGLGFA